MRTQNQTTELGFDYVDEPGRSIRTLLLLLGTEGDEHDLVALGRQLAPDAALLSPTSRLTTGCRGNQTAFLC